MIQVHFDDLRRSAMVKLLRAEANDFYRCLGMSFVVEPNDHTQVTGSRSHCLTSFAARLSIAAVAVKINNQQRLSAVGPVGTDFA